MKTILLTLILALQFAFAGDDVHNGGGIAESNFIYAHKRLSRFIKLCLQTPRCNLSLQERALLKKIQRDYNVPPLEGDRLLVFKSGKQEPDFFILDGSPKVAKTGSKPGSPIYINVDLIYRKNADGIYMPYSISEAAALLIHELGHHQGFHDHSALDLLGYKVAAEMNRNTSITSFVPGKKDISVWVYNGEHPHLMPQVLIYVGDKFYDVTQKVKEELKCTFFAIPSPIKQIPDLVMSFQRPRSVSLHNIHWGKFKMKEEYAKFEVLGNLIHNCKKSHTLFMKRGDYRLRIKFKLRREEISKGKFTPWTFDLEDDLTIRQFHEPWYKILTFENM